MKNTLGKISLIAATAFACCLTSCGKKDTADTLSDEMVTQMGELADAVSSAKDKDSAEAAAKKIDEIGDEFVAIAKRLEALGDPSDEDKKLVEEKMDKAEKEMRGKMADGMKDMMKNPEAAKIIGEAMEKFGKKMDDAEKIFEKYGKD